MKLSGLLQGEEFAQGDCGSTDIGR